MSFFNKIKLVTLASTTALATSVAAQELPASGYVFGANGSSFGDIVGNGTPTAVLDAFKDNTFKVESTLDGVGCLDCEDITADALVDVSEVAGLTGVDNGTESGTPFGSQGMLNLGALGFIGDPTAGFGFQAGTHVGGQVLGAGTGDNVSVTTNQQMGGNVGGVLTYNGSPCGVGICPTPNGQPSGDATQAFGSSGFVHGSVNVTASGLGAVALSNAFHGAATTALQPLTALPMPAAPVAAD